VNFPTLNTKKKSISEAGLAANYPVFFLSFLLPDFHMEISDMLSEVTEAIK